MTYEWIVLTLLWTSANADRVTLLECDPPDEPIGGGYGPKQSIYTPGDTVHYFCEADTFIGGNYFRKCEDTGRWSGNTPVCDAPSAFSSHSQSSTANFQSGSENAVDGYRDTCSSTIGGRRDEWSGTFLEPGQLIRVMLFLPIGQASFEVVLVRPNGQEIICGTQTRHIDRLEWAFQNCPEPHNSGASGLKIRSISNEPLRICEIQAYVLTSPKCTDPHEKIENGHLEMDRHKAVLKCDEGFIPSRRKRISCIREGIWNKNTLYCEDPNTEDIDEELATLGPRPQNPSKETERLTGRRPVTRRPVS